MVKKYKFIKVLLMTIIVSFLYLLLFNLSINNSLFLILSIPIFLLLYYIYRFLGILLSYYYFIGILCSLAVGVLVYNFFSYPIINPLFAPLIDPIFNLFSVFIIISCFFLNLILFGFFKKRKIFMVFIWCIPIVMIMVEYIIISYMLINKYNL